MLFKSRIVISKNINLFLIFFILLFFTTACGQPNKEIYKDSWKEDVLVAQECGLSGLTCCFDKEKKCEQGLECCLDPSDQAKGYCGESCDVGKVDKFCRKDEPRCDGTALCVNNYCAPCGVTGNPCCADNGCVDKSQNEDLHAECMNNVCTMCGNSEKPTCISNYKCSKGNLDSGGMCLKCGGLNQPCCAGEDVCKKNLKCQLGFCS